MDTLSSLIINVREHLNNHDSLEGYKLSEGDINEILDFNYKNLPVVSGEYSKTRVHLEDEFEIFFIVWDENLKTSLHSHPKNGCVMYLIEGDLIEKRVNDIMEFYFRFKDGFQSYIDDELGKHMITAKKVSYSCHIYSPPHYYDKN